MDLFDLFDFGIIAVYCIGLGALVIAALRHYRKRKWKATVCYTAALIFLIVHPGLSWGILPGSNVYLDLTQTYRLTGRAFLLGDAELSEHSRRHFNGDGFSIDIYSIPESVSMTFEAPSDRFFRAFPKRPGYRHDWDAILWQETPSQESDSKFIRFAGIRTESDFYSETNPRDVAAKLLNEKGNFYAYFYYMHRLHPGNVDLFILSPKKRLLVIVNQNT